MQEVRQRQDDTIASEQMGPPHRKVCKMYSVIFWLGIEPSSFMKCLAHTLTLRYTATPSLLNGGVKLLEGSICEIIQGVFSFL